MGIGLECSALYNYQELKIGIGLECAALCNKKPCGPSFSFVFDTHLACCQVFMIIICHIRPSQNMSVEFCCRHFSFGAVAFFMVIAFLMLYLFIPLWISWARFAGYRTVRGINPNWCCPV